MTANGITVVMTTYAPAGVVGAARRVYAWRTARALARHLRTPLPLRLHLADDGSEDPSYLSDILAVANEAWQTDGAITNAERRGIGGSLNLALQHMHDPYWLYVTDDWVLTEPLDLSPAVMLLERCPHYGMVRLGPTHPNLSCITRFSVDLGWWLDIDPAPGGFAFATRPFLAHRRFTDCYGPFPENMDAYETERLYAERIARWPGIGSGIVQLGTIPLAGPWEHIGAVEVGKTVIV